jgi:hypothetical protein
MTGYRKFSKCVWAVVRKRSGEIAWTQGSSIVFPKMMLYPNEGSARRALGEITDCEVKRIYPAEFKEHAEKIQERLCLKKN